jgi:hypothetical protein
VILPSEVEKMRIGVPKEVKTHEYRVGLTPASVRELREHGHEVLVEHDAGDAIGLTDALYGSAGAQIVAAAEEVFASAELIVKVKEPQAEELSRLREGQVLFTYLHLAPDPDQTKGLMASGCVAIAYETVTDPRGGLPLLAPMSAVAGRMSIQAGAYSLELARGGSGVLLPGVPGVAPGKVVIIGGGVVGTNAAMVALGIGARVVLLERSVRRIYELDSEFGLRLVTRYSTIEILEEELREADLVIGPPRPDEAGIGDRRRGDRPGRLHRDLAPDHPCRSDLRRGGRGPLLRRQHAGRGRQHLDLRAQQRDPALRLRDRRQGLPPGLPRRSPPHGRPQRPPRPHHPSRGRPRPRPPLHAAGGGTQGCLSTRGGVMPLAPGCAPPDCTPPSGSAGETGATRAEPQRSCSASARRLP